ncbi:DEAD/DEAH box helicase [Pyrofollis japonicus]|nr:DEAD/DEAH box helicase [Pyrofollis japonicus]
MATSLRALGYELVEWTDEGQEPEKTNTKFADVVPELSSHEKGSLNLYKHQLETIKALEDGRNVILTARTGSGKTEAWALAALRNNWHVLAIYPTLALAADQIKRLETYYSMSGRGKVVRVDRPSIGKRQRDKLLAEILSAKLVVTNPAFLLAELKRIAMSPHRALLEDFLAKLDLIVVDELDFYGARSAHLILSMIELIARYIASKPPRVVILSATLGNPEELGKMLSSITGRETKIVHGKPFKTPNRTIIVLGKGVDSLLNYIRAYSSIIASRAKWILDIAFNEEELREHLYEIYEALEAIGLRPPRPGLDSVEILQAVLESAEEGFVTLVFTKSIRMAEKLYRGLLERLPADQQGLVKIHHHLVPKDVRERIEEEARRGKIRMIITVRTLAQGIDIGNVNRVVHIGLPVDLREYMQREGRKGRRKDIGISETIVVPSGLWDRKLLEAGSSALKQWLSLHLEKLFVNPSNTYAAIFKALWKLLHGDQLSGNELAVVKQLGLVEEYGTLTGKGLGLSDKGRRFWNDIGFYEHGPPYGYRKVLIHRGVEKLLKGEEASHRDAIEKYQPGVYDSMTEALVVGISPRELRIYEEYPSEAVEEHDWLARAYHRYIDIKRGWGEHPSFENDLRYGRISTYVALNVKAPLNGFGELVEEPIDVEWFIESRRPRLLSRGGSVRVYHDVAVVELNSPVAGRYRDFTYGYVVEAPGDITAEDIRLGLATLMVYLRLDPEYAVPLGLIQYRVVTAGSMKLVHLWEREAAGLLEKIEWLQVSKKLEDYALPTIFVPMMAAIDPVSALRVIRGEVLPSDARALAIRVAKILGGSMTLRVAGLRIEFPKPSPSHGLASIYVLYDSVQTDRGNYVVAAIASYDGEKEEVSSIAAPLSLDTSSRLSQIVLAHLDKLLSRGFKIAYYGSEQRNLLIRMLAASYSGVMVLRGAESEGRLIDIAQRLSSQVGDIALLSYVEPRLRGVLDNIMKAHVRKDVELLEKMYVEAARLLARAIYKLFLALEKGRIERANKKDRGAH